MKRYVPVLTLLCLLLTACGGARQAGERQYSFWEEASGLPEDMVILTVDGREIPARRYLYWLERALESARAHYGQGEVDWTAPVEDGTLADYVKEQALADTVLYATVENWAEQYGCTLTEEEQTAARQSQTGELEAVGALYQKLCRLCREGELPLTPSAAELAAYAEETGQLTLDRILIAAGADREAARHRAEEAFAALNSADDQHAVFERLMEGDDDPRSARTIRLGDGEWSASLEQAALALAEGQISGILESEEGFSILRRLPPEREALLDGYFDARLQAAADAAVVCCTQEYEELEVEALARRFWLLREEGAED